MADSALCRYAGPVVSRGVLRQCSDHFHNNNGNYNSNYHDIEPYDYNHNYTCHNHHRNNDVYYNHNHCLSYHHRGTNYAHRQRRQNHRCLHISPTRIDGFSFRL